MKYQMDPVTFMWFISTYLVPENNFYIQTCWRAGKLDASKPDYCRPLVIKISDEENANDWTKNGRGNKTQSGFWINRDLCDADRKANFVARQEKRVRMNSAQT